MQNVQGSFIIYFGSAHCAPALGQAEWGGNVLSSYGHSLCSESGEGTSQAIIPTIIELEP